MSIMPDDREEMWRRVRRRFGIPAGEMPIVDKLERLTVQPARPGEAPKERNAQQVRQNKQGKR